jgi:hypothetical protein
VTNQLERAVAERDVVIDQVKTNQAIHATGERGVYTAAADEVKLTGAPVARTDRYVISNADYMIWQPKTNRFRAFGPYTIVPVKAQTNGEPPSQAMSEPERTARPNLAKAADPLRWRPPGRPSSFDRQSRQGIQRAARGQRRFHFCQRG